MKFGLIIEERFWFVKGRQENILRSGRKSESAAVCIWVCPNVEAARKNKKTAGERNKNRGGQVLKNFRKSSILYRNRNAELSKMLF